MRGPPWSLEGSISNIWKDMAGTRRREALERLSLERKRAKSGAKGGLDSPPSAQKGGRSLWAGNDLFGGSNCKPDDALRLSLLVASPVVCSRSTRGCVLVRLEVENKGRARTSLSQLGASFPFSMRRGKRQRREREKNQSGGRERKGEKEVEKGREKKKSHSSFFCRRGKERVGDSLFPRFDFNRSPLLHPWLCRVCRRERASTASRSITIAFPRGGGRGGVFSIEFKKPKSTKAACPSLPCAPRAACCA